MESLDWSSHHHYPLDGNNIFDNIGANVIISKDHLNPIKDATSSMLLHHHHHLSFADNNQPHGGRPILDSPAVANTCLYSPGLEFSRPETASGPGSFGSLSCLLSAAANSKAEATKSIEEDDGISMMIFSDCRSLWTNSMEIDSRNSPQEDIVLKPRSNTNGHDDPTDSNKRKRSSSSSSSEEDLKIAANKKPKKPRLLLPAEKAQQVKASLSSSSNINFQQPSSSGSSGDRHEPDTEAIAQMKEMIYRAAAFRPVDFGPEEAAAEKPRRKNVRISNYPQTVAARQRRERISERIRVLQRLVPGGNKMDTASMLDEAANYLKFLRSWVKALESLGHEIGGGNNNSAAMNLFSASSAAMNLNNLGFSVPFVNGAATMIHHHPQQPQFSFLNPSRS